MLVSTLLAASSFVVVGTLCVAAAACTCAALFVCQRFRLDTLYDRVQARLNLGWATRSFLSLLSFSLLAISTTWLLGAIDPAAYLSPGAATLVYSALLLAMPLFAVMMPAERSGEKLATQTGESGEEHAKERRAA